MTEDKRAEPPEPKVTVQLPAMTDRALLEDLARTSRETKKAVERVEWNQQLTDGQIRVIQSDIQGLFEWKGTVDQRLQTNSTRAQQTSSADLEHESKIAATIVKTQELEAAIHETRAIVEPIAIEIAKQSDFMGMGKRGLAWLRSKEARADLVRFVTLIGVGYAALKSAGVIK